MIILVGPSGAGKTRVANCLVSSFGYTRMVTCTTRPPRRKEINGKDYWFLSLSQFQSLIEQDLLLEYATYDGHMYGSLLTEAQKQARTVLVVEVVGAKYILFHHPELVSNIYMLDCSLDTQQKRLTNRGDDPATIAQRLLNDRELFEKEQSFLQQHTVCINTEDKTPAEIACIIALKEK